MENFDFQLKRGLKTREISTWMFFFLATFHLGSSSQIHDEKKNDFFFCFWSKKFLFNSRSHIKEKAFSKENKCSKIIKQ